jgi:(E)-4-hydroxy-3-methylbut-2-enyl-diphosphate synthase
MAVKRQKKIIITTMLKTPVEEPKLVYAEAKRADEAGADLIRVAIEKESSLFIIPELKKRVKAMIEADVHFDPRLTLGSIRGGADIVRFNPRNITDKKAVREFIACAKEYGTQIRIGINSGGFKGKFTDATLAKAMVAEAKKWLAFFLKEKMTNIAFSFKAQNVRTTIMANELWYAVSTKYPIHLGVTAAGPYEESVLKNAMAMGALLHRGIGDAIRLSLNAAPEEEVRMGRMVVQFLGLGHFVPEIISCPTCSRTRVDLRSYVEDFKTCMHKDPVFRGKKMHIALMGCVVNGPGEASQADIGIAFSQKGGKAALFKDGKVIGTIAEKDFKKEIVKHVKR